MAQFNSKILEQAGGSLGKLVVYSVGDKTYVRTKPAHYKDRKTLTQLTQRQKFQLVMDFLKPFTPLLRLTFPNEKGDRRGFHPAKSYNLKQGISGNYPNQNIDKQKALLSRGPLPQPSWAHIQLQEQGILFEWEPGNEPGNATDTLLVIAMVSHSTSCDYQFTGVKRSEGKFHWPTSLIQNNNTLEFWLAFRNLEETLMSDSLYLGELPR